MQKTLQLSADLVLPLDGVTQTLAFIARKGGGKSYGASLLAEQMLDAGAQVLVIDCVGTWYGLRLAADGKSPGKSIYVFGGEHGDVPLTPESGARVAQLVVEKRVSVVLDVSSFRTGERKRFSEAFAEEFFHRKKSQRSPVHLFVEEAQKVVPQMPGPEEKRMLGAFEDIVRLGRNYGIGCTLISQRPQSVNKEVLSQTECLIVLQVNGVHERKALEAWVQEAGADRALVGELPSLQVGEAYVWSPAWLRTFKRVRIGRKVTFDASATPEVGKAVRAGTLSPMDVEALKADMAEVVAAAEKDDPKALRRRIGELEQQLRKAPTPPPAPPAPEIAEDLKRLEKALGRLEKHQAAFDKGLEKLNSVRDAMAQAQTVVVGSIDNLAKTLGWVKAVRGPTTTTEPLSLAAARVMLRPLAPLKVGRQEPIRRAAPAPRRAAPTCTGNDAAPGDRASLNGAQLRVLDALAWWEAIGVAKPTRLQLAFGAGYTVNGHFNNVLGSLNTAGLICYPGDGKVQLTESGNELATIPETPTTPDALQAMVRAKLNGPRAKLFDALVKAWPEAMTRDQLAAEAGYTVNGHFNNVLGSLHSMGAADYPDRGAVRASPVLFLEGA